MLKIDATFGTTVTVAHSSVPIASHIVTVKSFLHGVLHTTLSRVTGKRRKMC